MEIFNGEFHFLRPAWLLMIIPVLILSWLFWSKKLFNRNWESVIDSRLLPHLLVGKVASKSIRPILLWSLLAVIASIALAGPVWKKLPLPVFKQQSALVILLDLSTSMNAQDIKPSRLVRARLKLLDLLQQRKEGQTALIAYAGTAYTVSPLTDDTDTIQSLVSSLSTQIMPAQGSRTDLAVSKAVELFNNAGLQKGDILLLTDGLQSSSIERLQAIKLQDYRLSILAIGSEQGAPVPADGGGFVKDDQGSIVIAKTDFGKLNSIASQYGGKYQQLTLDDADLHSLQKLFDDRKPLMDQQQTDFKADRWREEGPWLLLLVVPFAALAFRRGIFLSIALLIIFLPLPQPASALDLPDSWPKWDSLWKNTNQRAQNSLTQGNAEKAAELFDRADWKAAAQYKAGQYEQALQQLENINTPDGIYNRGNTLAKMGRLQEALESYDNVLKQQPENEDAKYNRKLVEDALKKQQQQQQQQQKQDGEKSDQQKNDQQKNDQQNKDQNQQQQNSDQQNPEQQNSQQSGNEGDPNNKQQNLNQQSKADQDKQEKTEQEKAKQDKAKQDKAKQEQQAAQREAEKQQAEQQDAEARQQSEQQKTEDLSDQAEAQWLRKIPDDPGGLLRNKFRYQYGRQQQRSEEKELW